MTTDPTIRKSPHQAIQRRAIERARSSGFTWPPDYEVSNIGQCRSCGATILWTVTPRGARSPLDKDGRSHFGNLPDGSAAPASAMTAARRYAEGTAVTVDNSRAEMTKLLTAHGCVRMAWASEPEADTLQFALGGQSYRFVIARPTLAEAGAMYPNAYDREAKRQGEWRRRWRAHVLLLKAKLEFVAGGDTTLEREFMPNLVLKTGATMSEWLADSGQRMLGAGAPT